MPRPFVGVPPLKADDILAVKVYVAVSDRCQPDDRSTQGRFTAARLADQTEHIPPIELEVNTVDGLDRGLMMHQKAFPDGEMNVQVFDLQ